MVKKIKQQRQAANVQQSSVFQYMIILILLSILNISFFFGYGRSRSHLQCSADTLVQVISLYLTGNGETTLESILPSQCTGIGNDLEKDLKTSIRGLLAACESDQGTGDPVSRSMPLLTLFTTFAEHNHSDSEKVSVHNNTLANWATFKPAVNLILFSNNANWTKVAKSYGWDVITTLMGEKERDPPVLKDMFYLAMARYKTAWYGYVNADILFTSDLILNLETLTKRYNTSHSRVLLTGRRTNVANLTHLNPLSEYSIKQTAKEYGHLYSEDAEDYFICTRPFPWRRVLPVVVGRPGYDNWLIGEARCRLNATVVDVTDTLLAFHQTTTKGGNSEGHFHSDSDLNYKILKKYKIVPNFLAGLTDCIIFYTYRTFCDTLDVGKRTNFGPRCSCYVKPFKPK